MTPYEETLESLRVRPRTWLVTGVAGFIGSNLLEALLRLGQTVVGLDNFATGSPLNLLDVQEEVGPVAWGRFRFLEGDIRNLVTCREGVAGVDVVLHQAALGSVPRSIMDPLASHQANVDGTLNMLLASRDAGCRMVFASSSSVYGDNADLPKVEDRTGNVLSPYALTKATTERYAAMFELTYAFKTIGLRYFNVFGPRQNPNGPYAAVIPRWISDLLADVPTHIHGDGSTSRDFCFVANVIQANLLAGCVEAPEALGQIYNISCGGKTSLLDLHNRLRTELGLRLPGIPLAPPAHGPNRVGDIAHSLADISKAQRLLGYGPTHQVSQGLAQTVAWYVSAKP